MTESSLHRRARWVAGFFCAILALSAQAQSQNLVTVPGGFVTACAGIKSGGGFTPGGNLEALFGGTTSCQTKQFSGTEVKTASWSYQKADGTATNSAQGTAALGVFSLKAANSSPNYDYFAGAANGGWTQSMIATASNTAGHPGFVVVEIDVSGTLAAHGFAGASGFFLTAYKNGQQLDIYNGAGSLFNSGNSTLMSTTDRQFTGWSVSTDFYNGTGVNDASATINEKVNFAIPVVFGETFSFGVYGYALASMRSASGVPGISSSTTDFSHTVTWGGVVGMYDQNKNLLTGYSLKSSSGVDWTGRLAAPVPEPETYAMFLAGLGLMGVIARRRKRGA